MTPSVLTLAHGRAGHLANLVRGLAASEHKPAELIICVLQDDRYELPPAPFPVRQIMAGEEGLALAAARNAAAAAASGDLLIFLDVDCIPHPNLVSDYRKAAALTDGIFMGEVGYLPKAAPLASLDYAVLDQLAVKHSERAGPPADFLGPCEDYRCFWSLNFAISAELFQALGGFDERYVGYGGEDTDFGRTSAEAGVPLWWVRGAKAYHQYHPHHMPPVHHIDSVLANAKLFARKWGKPTMEHWLRAFSLMGLIAHGENGWERVREVRESDLALTRQQQHQPFASSATVLKRLEAERSLSQAVA
ncbi:galactosyltransferase-related protein [Qipengyuania sediminis]|uniref:galactosyltransferase-related protein n=1 Tax=Qipengyuania sediminis TaxID=1532023 RepID=UPI00105A6459|nr:galactosyltransferase-related protein [Qipengyuania sediminis]